MRIIRDISNDIKDKVKCADRDIHKAIERKIDYPQLGNAYYTFSVNCLDDILSLHDEVVALIQEYRGKNGEPPKTMLDLWDWKHKEILEDIAEIKSLQEFYKNL